MAWNEPGKNGNDNDPWGGGGRRGGDKGPPDIDEVFKNLSNKLNGLFGGRSGGRSGSGGSSGGGGGGGLSVGLIAGLAVLAVVIWAFTGFYQVEQAERGVVLRFGKVLDEVVQPGLRWNPPLIDEVTLVNIQELNTRSYSNDMLTTDENIVNMAVAVQYRIDEPVKYVIAVQEPERSLDNAAESAIRHVVGGNFMDEILTTGRARVAAEVQGRLQDYMDVYNTGIRVSVVNVVDAQPPDAVRPAFDDVIRAREDEERVQNQAHQYSNRVIPEARGEAQRAIEQANAYKQQSVARAIGDASRFDQILTEYSKAPEVTRQRLYIEALQDVMTASSKIMVDVEGGNNMLYLPLDQILKQSSTPLSSRNSDDLRALAREVIPFLPSGSSAGDAVDRNRLTTNGRGGR